MRPPLCMLAVLLLWLGVAACGNSNRSATSTAGTTRESAATSAIPSYTNHGSDRDNDDDHNDDDAKDLYFGHTADTTDRSDSAALVTRYFAAAAAEDGAAGCSMLISFVAEGLPEEYGHSPGLRGRTCAVVLSKVFKLHHPLLAKKQATLEVISVRVEDDRALVFLAFPTIPEVRQMIERRVDGKWRLIQLQDDILE